MYSKLKEMMPHADFFYGPTTKEVAFDVPYHSYAVPVGNQWYIGVSKECPEYAHMLIEKPPTPPEPPTEAPTDAPAQP